MVIFIIRIYEPNFEYVPKKQVKNENKDEDQDKDKIENENRNRE